MRAKGREGEEKPIRGTERGTQRQEEDGEARGVLEWRKRAEESDTCIRECVIKFNLQPS